MFANFTHASSELYLLSLKDDARHQQRSFAECCQIWPFLRRQRRNAYSQSNDMSIQPPRQVLGA